jgi:pseudouridine-5'-phosphate glycosidase
MLSVCPVVTVCSGPKSVLDIPRTLEALESLGVPVFGWRTGVLPAFYVRESGLGVTPVECARDVVDITQVHADLGYRAGLVVANPIPVPDAISRSDWSAWLSEARREAELAGVAGKDVTPYLLERVARYSAGRTVQANLSLLRDNARVAAEIAVALSS